MQDVENGNSNGGSMIKISKQADSLLLSYVPDGFNSVQWLDEKLKRDGKVIAWLI